MGSHCLVFLLEDMSIAISCELAFEDNGCPRGYPCFAAGERAIPSFFFSMLFCQGPQVYLRRSIDLIKVVFRLID